MGLVDGGIRGVNGIRMAADTKGNRSHVMAMRMVVEVGAISIIMAAQTRIASHMTNGAADQQSGRIVMAGITSGLMGLGAGGVWSGRGDMTVDTQCTRQPHVMGTGMRGEIVTMTGQAVATAIIAGRAANGHIDGRTVGRLQGCICVMTGGTGIMHLAI